MATRACIAMPQGKSWVGVYSHWDGYPTGLGNVLWTLMECRYDFDVQRAWKELIMDNPEGWSTLNCFHSEWGSAEAVLGWDGTSKLTVEQDHQQTQSGDFLTATRRLLPVSYQNDPMRSGGKTEPTLTPRNCMGSGVEYVYVLHPTMIDVWEVGQRLRRWTRWKYAEGRPQTLLPKAA